jgi:hypothetical protein
MVQNKTDNGYCVMQNKTDNSYCVMQNKTDNGYCVMQNKTDKTDNGYCVMQNTNFTNVFFTFKILYNIKVHVIYVHKKVLSSLHKFTQDSQPSTGICADRLQQILCNQTINADTRDTFFYMSK